MTEPAAVPIVPYSPARDMLENWPGWRVQPANLGGSRAEFMFTRDRVFVVDWSLFLADPEGVNAHCVGHLVCGHHERPTETFTEWDEACAEWVAQIRLDRPPGRI